jgi:hypothetical protein
MAINWSLAQQPNVLAMALEGYEQGKQMRRDTATRNALGALVQNPNDQAAFGELAQNAPEYAMQFRGQQQQVQLGQAKQRGDQMQQLGRLLNHATDETTYQQSLAAAKQIGLDVSSAPPSFDPNWVGQQRLVLQAYEKDGGQALTSEARNLVQLGYKPGTPEFQQALAQAVNAGFAKPYTGQGGETRLYSPNIAVPAQMAPQQAPAQPRKPVSMQAAMDVVRQAGPQAAEFVRNNGFAVQVTTPDEARQLPSGTPIILPDGSEGVVP